MSKATRAVLDYCAHVLSEVRNEPFLVALFSRPKGEWVPVRSLCGEAATPTPPESGPGVDLLVGWLDEPEKRDGYCAVVFFSPAELWSYAAIYNRVWLLDARKNGRNSPG
jgi:hypothetical protein